MVTISIRYHIGGILVSVPASSALDHGFQHQSGQTKDYWSKGSNNRSSIEHRMSMLVVRICMKYILSKDEELQ